MANLRRGDRVKINSRDWVFVTGKAYTGKTHWIRAHLAVVPETRPVCIYDFTAEYKDLAQQKNMAIFAVQRGNAEEIGIFANHVYNLGNCTVILSEADNYLRMNQPVLLALVTTGRNRGINAIVDAKRPMSVRPEYRGRFNHLVLFQTTLPDDIDYLEQWAGTGKGSLEILRDLEQGEHIHINTDTQEMSGIKRL
jgi:hypothetical protein